MKRLILLVIMMLIFSACQMTDANQEDNPVEHPSDTKASTNPDPSAGTDVSTDPNLNDGMLSQAGWDDIWMIEPQFEYTVGRWIDFGVFITHIDGEDYEREVDPKTGELLGEHYGYDAPEENIIFDETHQLFGKQNDLGEFWLMQDTQDIEMGFVGVRAVVLNPDSDYVDAFDGYMEISFTYSSKGMAMMYNRKLITEFYENIIAIPNTNRKNQSIAFMYKNGKWAFLNKEGILLTDFCFDDVEEYVIGTIAVKKSEKWGFVTESGETVIPFIFDAAVSIDEDTAFVQYEGKTGILNKKISAEYFKD